MNQLQPRHFFDGNTYQPELDFVRLKGQLERVKWLLLHPIGKWWTLEELKRLAGGSETSISARVRDLRKGKFGALGVESRRRDGGLWEYRVRP